MPVGLEDDLYAGDGLTVESMAMGETSAYRDPWTIHHFQTVVIKRLSCLTFLYIVNKTQSLDEQPPVSSVYEGGMDMNKYSFV